MNLSGIQFLLAQQSGGGANATAHMVLFMGAKILFFWFLVIQPQRKREKALKAMLAALRPGDKIVTSGGIVGVVLALKDKSVSIRSSDAKLEILKSSIGEVTKPADAGEGGAS